MKTTNYVRRPLRVQAVQVSEDNVYDVAKWCGGEVRRGEGGLRVKVDVFNPSPDAQTEAEVGFWVLKSGRGFKVYNNTAFEATFEAERKYELTREGREPST